MPYKDQDVMLRKEKAGQKAVRVQKIEVVEYKVENDDILILSGPYVGNTVRQLFPMGPNERDYIISKIWFTGDPEVVKIINTLVCK